MQKRHTWKYYVRQLPCKVIENVFYNRMVNDIFGGSPKLLEMNICWCSEGIANCSFWWFDSCVDINTYRRSRFPTAKNLRQENLLKCIKISYIEFKEVAALLPKFVGLEYSSVIVGSLYQSFSRWIKNNPTWYSDKLNDLSCTSSKDTLRRTSWKLLTLPCLMR